MVPVREFPLVKWWRWLYLGLGPVLLGAGIYWLAAGQHLMGAIFGLFGGFALGLGLRCRLTWDGTWLRYREMFRTQEMRVADIVGWRDQPRPSPGRIAFEDARGNQIRVARVFELDPVFCDWLLSLPDLDAAEAEAGLRKIEQAGQLELFERCRIECRVLNGAGMALGLWGFVHPAPYAPLLWALMALPWIAVALAGYRKPLVRLDVEAKYAVLVSPPTVAVAVFLPALVVAVRALFDVTLLASAGRIAAVSVAIGLPLWLFMMWADRETRGSIPMAGVMLILASVYGYGSGTVANVLLEERVQNGRAKSTRVAAKRISSGKQTRYLLELEGYGEVSVDFVRYQSREVGSAVQVREFDGALGMPWLRLE